MCLSLPILDIIILFIYYNQFIAGIWTLGSGSCVQRQSWSWLPSPTPLCSFARHAVSPILCPSLRPSVRPYEWNTNELSQDHQFLSSLHCWMLRQLLLSDPCRDLITSSIPITYWLSFHHLPVSLSRQVSKPASRNSLLYPYFIQKTGISTSFLGNAHI